MPKEAIQDTEASKELARASEGGSRNIIGKIGLLITLIAISMSLFQLYTGFFGELPGAKQLSIHLTFAMVLCFLCFPFSQKSSKNRVSIFDAILAIIGGATALYLFVNYDHVVHSVGNAPIYDIVIGAILIVLVLEATRRSVSPILPIITIIFLLYAFFGPYLPGDLAHRGFRVFVVGIDHVVDGIAACAPDTDDGDPGLEIGFYVGH